MNNRAYYTKSIDAFLKDDPDTILGKITRDHEFSLEETQKKAWIKQVQNLQQQLSAEHKGEIFFEFSIPRMGKRVDVILLINDIVFVLEYKVGSDQYDKYAIDQALDYALDLKNFHEGSHNRYIVPILIATKGQNKNNEISWYDDKVCETLLCNEATLNETIWQVLKNLGISKDYGKMKISEINWSESGYKPTPTIIEAAQALYQNHNVEEISRSDSGAKNLTETANCIMEIIEKSKKDGKKSICFVTGVPGSGKTLAGLNISTQTANASAQEHAVFLSGNGPLVDVLREALARDKVAYSKQQNNTMTKKNAVQEVNAFIQNIHHFRDEGLKSQKAPSEHVVIFDEAQRAWNQEHAEKFMRRKGKAEDFDMSEPEFLIKLMDRHEDWCTIICLIGGGQEINTGEAGLIEWLSALQNKFPHWDVHHSVEIKNANYNLGEDLDSKFKQLNAFENKSLHLSVSIRSFRAEKLSDFIGAIIDGDSSRAAEIKTDLNLYNLALTRNVNTARKWLKSHARGTERFGLVASSGSMRLKPEGIHAKARCDAVNWFLNDKYDVRSSYYLEDIATEFDIQGLELDWTGVCWDADLRMEDSGWGYYNFKGTKWQSVKNYYRQIYLANAYRVLLTRARQGMVIFVPRGDDSDYTRLTEFYDKTYNFLVKCGIEEI